MNAPNEFFDPNKVQDFVFTFGFGHPHQGCYVIFTGTYDTARDQMIHAFGRKWANQYLSEKAAGVDRFKLKRIY